MLQYALLHLYGYELSIDDLKKFRVSAAHDTLECLNLPGVWYLILFVS